MEKTIQEDKCECGALRWEHHTSTIGPGLGPCERTGCKKFVYANPRDATKVRKP